jgi:hypothetical protein
LTPVITFAPIEYLVDVDCLIATLILIEAVVTYLHLWGLWVVSTITHLSDWVIFLTSVTPDQVQV